MAPDANAQNDVHAIKPPASIDAPTVYILYRGILGKVENHSHRIWVQFTTAQLCWARNDLPAESGGQMRLKDITECNCDASDGQHLLKLEVHAKGASTNETDTPKRNSIGENHELLHASGPSMPLQEFCRAMNQLLKSRDEEGPSVLEFIQMRLFQYLWVRQGALRSEEEIYEAQVVLAFNLDPKQGVAYLRRQLGRNADSDVGVWLAHMSAKKGAIDPTLLGNYFSKLDTFEVTRTFIEQLDFQGLDIVPALRKLFDTFKPGGEAQIIMRILEVFANTYLNQWRQRGGNVEPAVAYQSADTVLQVAYQIIMLNTGMHVVGRKLNKQSCHAACVPLGPSQKGIGVMTMEQYIKNIRSVVSSDEVPEEALRLWYEDVEEHEIALEPLPRMPFSTLPVQPNIEGWLVAVLGPCQRRRRWGVLALQRLYLFSDADDVEPSDVLDLRSMSVGAVARNADSRKRFAAELRGAGPFAWLGGTPKDFPELADRSFELWCEANGAEKPQPIRLRETRPRDTLILAAETADLAKRWVGLVGAGPY